MLFGCFSACFCDQFETLLNWLTYSGASSCFGILIDLYGTKTSSGANKNTCTSSKAKCSDDGNQSETDMVSDLT